MKKTVIIFLLICIGVLPLCAQSNWTKYSADPIIPSTFDSKAYELYDPSVLLDNGTYKMWYTRKVAATEKIAYATSPDGINWTLVDTAALAPLTSNTSRFDFNKVGQASVIKDNDTLKMWYWGDGPNIGNIGYAWSLDGRTWTRVDGPKSDKSVFDRTADGSSALAVVTPSVVKVGSTYHMWYTRIGATGNWNIAYANSQDGLNWTNVAGTGTAGAVLDLGAAGNFDESIVAYPMVLATSTGFEMWYTARDNVQTTRIGYATSTDGIHWTRVTGSAPQGAVLDAGQTCAVIKTGNDYKMWYVYDNTELFYATANVTAVAGSTSHPSRFTLEQNYPNPFNPSTTITFSISSHGLVTLKIYDVLGRYITTIVNEDKSAGTHSVQWNAAGMQSGVYFYTLQSGNNIETKKLLLLK